MSLQERLQQELKGAMRKGDVTRRSLIRYLRAQIHDQEIASRTTLDDDAVIGLLGKQVQQRHESIDAFKRGNRLDLVEKEEAELAMLMEYLPQQLTADELASLARDAVEESGATGPQDIGKVMGLLMPRIRGKAEGKAASAAVIGLLQGLGE